ncbi:hypothetical protein [Kluyvera huaxiensis]|uniref:hypothetical protein n=1 Tax=Kluyvera sp. 142053 TaxID=3160979 RepID=UPI0032DF4F6E
MTFNLTDPANQLTDEQVVTLQLRIMSALSFYRQRPEKEARRMAELLELAGAAASELQGRRKSDALPATQPSRMSGIMPDYEGVAMTQRECYMAGKEAGLAEARKSPVIPDGYVLVPVEPTLGMLDEFDSIIDYGAEDSKDAWRRLLTAAPQEVK